MRFWPKSLLGQLMLLATIILIVTQIVLTSLLFGDRQIRLVSGQYSQVIDRVVKQASELDIEYFDGRPYQIEQDEDQSFMFISVRNRADEYDHLAPQKRQAELLRHKLESSGVDYLQAFISLRKDMSRQPRQPRPRPPTSNDDRRLPPFFHPRNPPDRSGLPAAGLQEIRVSVELKPGVWLNSFTPLYSGEAISQRLIIGSLLIFLLSGCAFFIFARRLLGPLKALQEASNNLGKFDKVEALPLRGPSDIQETTQAFNHMQSRLTRVIQTQQSMLRAIGHDLRTPLTALRIRSENIENENTRAKIVEGLGRISSMTEEILGWASDATSSEPYARVDLNSLLESLIDDFSEMGHKVSFETSTDQVMLDCKRLGLRRAVTNLLDNAVKYGGQARLDLFKKADEMCIQVSDYGPGIPEDKLLAVMDPFVRIEESRNKETGGMGLGLAITQTIVERHGGSLTLRNRDTTGLVAEICLPNELS